MNIKGNNDLQNLLEKDLSGKYDSFTFINEGSFGSVFEGRAINAEQ